MWTTASKNKSIKSSMFIFSVFYFNTHADINIDSILESQNDVVYCSNIAGQAWSSVDISLSPFASEQQIQGIADIVEKVKICLGLPNKDIAKILGVSRQTLHSYKNSTDEHHTVNAANKKRAMTISNVINEIQPKFSRSPGAMAKNYMMNDKSLFDLMSEPELDIPNILHLSQSLAEKMSSNSTKTSTINEISLNQLTKFA